MRNDICKEIKEEKTWRTNNFDDGSKVGFDKPSSEIRRNSEERGEGNSLILRQAARFFNNKK